MIPIIVDVSMRTLSWIFKESLERKRPRVNSGMDWMPKGHVLQITASCGRKSDACLVLTEMITVAMMLNH